MIYLKTSLSHETCEIQTYSGHSQSPGIIFSLFENSAPGGRFVKHSRHSQFLRKFTNVHLPCTNEVQFIIIESNDNSHEHFTYLGHSQSPGSSGLELSRNVPHSRHSRFFEKFKKWQLLRNNNTLH